MKIFSTQFDAHPERLTGRHTNADDELDFERGGGWVYDFTTTVGFSGLPEVSAWIEENQG